MKRISLIILAVIMLVPLVVSASPISPYETRYIQMAEFSLQALHDEIENDPEGIGYKDGSVWKGDAEIADLINAKNYKIDRNEVPSSAIIGVTHYEAYNDLLADRQEWIRWKTSADVWVVEADMKLQLTGRTLAVGGVAGTGDDADSFWSLAERGVMVPKMLALIEVDGSRAEVLWGEGKIVSISEVAYAANQ